MNRGSLVCFAARLLISERGMLLRLIVFFSPLRVDHPSKSRQKYLAALEKVDTLTPLILPSFSYCSLILFGWTQVYLVVDVYFTSVGISIPLQQLPLLQFQVILPQVLAQRFSDLTAGMQPTQPGTWASIALEWYYCCSRPSFAGMYPIQPTMAAFLLFPYILKLYIYTYTK